MATQASQPRACTDLRVCFVDCDVDLLLTDLFFMSSVFDEICNLDLCESVSCDGLHRKVGCCCTARPAVTARLPGMKLPSPARAGRVSMGGLLSAVPLLLMPLCLLFEWMQVVR